MSSRGIVVVGGGIAAQSLCEAVRERDPGVPLTMVNLGGDEAPGPDRWQHSPACSMPAGCRQRNIRSAKPT